jgi:3-oxoacyl-[acyl-carrier protein] reductase
MHDLAGRVAFITGAAGDLGRVIAEALAAAGADVAVHCRADPARGEPVAEACRAKGRRAAVITGDIADLAAMTAARDRAVAALGPIDIVVANAVSQLKAWQDVLDQPLDDYLDQFRTCVLHAVVAAKVFVPSMRARRWGRFIGINTECVIECRAGSSAYASGKGGMDRVLRCLAKEIGKDGVTVNQIAPGWMISARNRKAGGGADEDALDAKTREWYVGGVPLGHRGTDGDIAEAVTFLASEGARFITGAMLPVCGGRAMTAI